MAERDSASTSSPARSAGTHGVVVRWWVDRGRALAFYASAAATGLLFLALRTGQFQSIHRALMGAFGVACAYFAAVRLVNITRLSIRDRALWVRHGPLPWPGGMTVALADVDDVAIDKASLRLQLRTAQGEEIALVDDVTAGAAERLEGELRQLVQDSREQARAGDED